MEHFSDDNLEEILLSMLLNNLNFLNQYMHKISDALFVNIKYKALFSTIEYNFNLSNSLLTELVLKGVMQDNNKTEDVVEEYLLLYLRLKDRKVVEGDAIYSIEKLRDLYIKRASDALIKDTVSNIDSIKGEALLQKIEESLAVIREDSKTVEIVQRFIYTNAQDRLKEYLDLETHPEKQKSIPYGIQALDEHTGGMHPGEFYLVVGGPKSGKSRFLFNIAYNNVIKGNTVLYITIEMPIKQVERMFDSRHGKISYNKLKFGNLQPNKKEEYINIINNIGEPQFYIIDIPYNCTPSIIRQKIKDFKRTHKLDLVVVDYLSLVNGDIQYKSGWEKEMDIAKQFKQIARSEGISLASAAQLNKEARKGKKVGMEYIALGDIAPHCDIIMQLIPMEENMMEVQLTGDRDGGPLTFYMNTYWDENRMTNTLDGINSSTQEGTNINGTPGENQQNQSPT